MISLTPAFFQQSDVTTIARQLLGKLLVSGVGGFFTSGIIVETEAYSFKERGCHAWNKRLTPRTKVMFGPGGTIYVYFCYGMHHLFNVVTNVDHEPEAVLIRALEPLEGLDTMRLRRGVHLSDFALTSGPAKLSQALGISLIHNQLSVIDSEVKILDSGVTIPNENVTVTPRIGIDYAGTDAQLPWRYLIRDNAWVSK
jgi:DNA-3-methyladenine glycosylase